MKDISTFRQNGGYPLAEKSQRRRGTLDDGSEGRFWAIIRNIFKKNDLEEHILDAQDEGALRSEDVSMLLNVLDLKKKAVDEVMVPRTEMVCCEVDLPLAEIGRRIVESGHSRIPLYRENKDRIVGILHAKDILAPLLSGDESADASMLMRPPFFVSESAKVNALLKDLQNKRIHLAIVLDEYGGTAGLVTLEDLIEEIVGEIEDEYDVERPEEIIQTGPDAYLVSGRASLEELAERLGLKLTSEQVETVGGYLAELAGRVPAKDEFFTFSGHRFTIKEADAKHISSILVQPVQNLL